MYEAFYGFDVLPFSNTPNARFFYQSEQHNEALAKLVYTVQNRRGIALVTGQIGCGKTMLIRAMIQRLGKHASMALINNTRVTGEQLLRMITSELGLKLPQNSDKSDILTGIRRFATSEHQQGRTVAIVIDEAQALPVEAFEELRLLTNLENETQKLVQLLILGQPELANVLRHPRLGPLTQRIGMYCHLEPMTETQMAQYIAFRLIRASGQRPNVDFSTAALKLIYKKSRGIPRMINLIADNALLVGFSEETRFIDSKIVSRAIEKHLPAFEATVVHLDDVLHGTRQEIAARAGLDAEVVIEQADKVSEVAHG
ncbi:MAG TPA: ATPase [Phycisphaerales bacterium]|nr:ATPase [Phycisphaerales bacterium]|tara:strand:- start:6904 stop:7845 length:942 start_codon:yes stop_codon:yes gene_type:complete